MFKLLLLLIGPTFGELKSKVGATTSITLTAFFYSLYHLLSVYFIFSFPFNLLAGLMWGYFRYKLKSIVAPIISHVLADLGIMLVYINLITLIKKIPDCKGCCFWLKLTMIWKANVRQNDFWKTGWMAYWRNCLYTSTKCKQCSFNTSIYIAHGI